MDPVDPEVESRCSSLWVDVILLDVVVMACSLEMVQKVLTICLIQDAWMLNGKRPGWHPGAGSYQPRELGRAAYLL